MNKIIAVLAAVVLLVSCQQEPAYNGEKSVEEIKNSGKIPASDYVRLDVSADDVTNKEDAATMEFEEIVHNFGEATEGEIVEHTYHFKNTGKMPLLISDARSTCGCTVPDYPKTPIEPGESGTIKVRFNTAGKAGVNDKPITIRANTYPNETVLHLKGIVNKAK